MGSTDSDKESWNLSSVVFYIIMQDNEGKRVVITYYPVIFELTCINIRKLLHKNLSSILIFLQIDSKKSRGGQCYDGKIGKI